MTLKRIDDSQVLSAQSSLPRNTSQKRAANKATEQASRLASKIPSVPSWDVLKGDWKFWIAVLAVISVGSSLLGGAIAESNSLPNNADPGSYYI